MGKELKLELGQMVSDLFVLVSKAAKIQLEDLLEHKTVGDLKDAVRGTPAERYLKDIPDSSTLFTVLRFARNNVAHPTLDCIYDDPEPHLETVNSYFKKGTLRKEGRQLVNALVNLSQVFGS